MTGKFSQPMPIAQQPLRRILPYILFVLGVLPALSACGNAEDIRRQAEIKTAQDRAEAQLKIQGSSFSDYVQIYDSALRDMDDVLKHPEFLRDDSGEGGLSYATPPSSPGGIHFSAR